MSDFWFYAMGSRIDRALSGSHAGWVWRFRRLFGPVPCLLGGLCSDCGHTVSEHPTYPGGCKRCHCAGFWTYG